MPTQKRSSGGKTVKPTSSVRDAQRELRRRLIALVDRFCFCLEFPYST